MNSFQKPKKSLFSSSQTQQKEGSINEALDDEFHLDAISGSTVSDDVSSFVRAKNNRKYLKGSIGTNSRSYSDVRPPSPLGMYEEKDGPFSHGRTCVRVFVFILLFIYILLMTIWVIVVRKNNHPPSSPDTYSSDLNDICSFMLIKNGDHERCHEVCDPIRCCWDVNDETFGECSEYDPNFCAQFLPCQSLPIFSIETTPDPSVVAPPPQNINELCAKVSGTYVNEQLCFSTCIKGKCCFDPSKKLRCASKYDSICSLYVDPCSDVLYSVFLPNNHNPYSN